MVAADLKGEHDGGPFFELWLGVQTLQTTSKGFQETGTGVHGSFWNLETAHFGTWLILEPRRKENSPGLQRETNFAAHFGTRIIR